MQTNPYLLSGSFSYDTILTHDGHFHSRILPASLDKLNVSFGVESSDIEFGGTAGNIAYNASLLNEFPLLVGCLGGNDGDRYLRRLEHLGLDGSTLTCVLGKKTAQAFIMTDNNNNQITGFDKGALSCMPGVPAWTPHLWHLAPDLATTTATLAVMAIENNKKFLFDPGQALPAFLEGDTRNILPLDILLREAAGIFLNEYETSMLIAATGKPLHHWIKDDQFLVSTRGGAGMTLFDKHGETHVDVVTPYAVIDPTGCGDAVRAGFLYGYLREWELNDCARFGAVMGSLAIEDVGGQRHRPDEREIAKRFANYALFSDLDSPRLYQKRR